ncbi:MAG: glutamate-cysteine ligase family protein [bacterium]
MTTARDARTLWAEDYVRAHCFGGASSAKGPLTFGAELELLAFDAHTFQIAPIAPRPGSGCSLEAVRDVARQCAWRETISDKGVPKFVSVDGGSLTFEPGGQIEYASAVHHSVDGVLVELDRVESALRASAERVGITLFTVGVDPFNAAECAPLQLTAPRYRQMAEYFAAIGPDGARMMRQTASLQVNIGGIEPLEHWAVANAITPWLVALFANSPRYAGANTGCASFRAQTWRGVDPSRTGVFAGGDAIREYTMFALSAPAFLADDAAPAFIDLDDDLVSHESFSTHLTTLFPEVRPRGYLELRSLDAVNQAQRRAGLALIAGLLGDSIAARDAFDLVGRANETLLCLAGTAGLREPRLASLADDLVRIGAAGCERLGSEIVSESSLGSLHALRHC